ncbi:MAG: M20/M25/M40 family metallo-hydrolase [Phycisphaeraceae bacterium]|nr:MAG: M20/M25/M40 family metallo-hydrolase [Phycisphaeraceae bacterium]
MIAAACALAFTLAPINPADAVEKDRLQGLLTSIPTKRAALGDAEHRRGLADTERWLTQRLDALSLPHAAHEFEWTNALLEMALRREATPAQDTPPLDPPAPRTPPTWRNYIVELKGDDLAREVLILGAHYDAFPNTPGADDNATGVAAALETLRALKDQPRRRTLRVAFFTLEEAGLVGSRQLVKDHRHLWTPTKNHPQPPEALVGMVSLEMLGFFSDDPDSQKLPPGAGAILKDPESLTVGDFIAVGGIARHRAFSGPFAKALQDAEPSLRVLVADAFPIAPPDLLRSDHGPFIAAGLPAVILTDTANFRNPNYHKPTDTTDTIDLDRFALTVRAIVGATHTLLNPPRDDAPTP